MRRMLTLAIVLTALLPAAAASAHVEGTDRPVVFLPSANDCEAKFGKMKAAIAELPIELGGEKHQFGELTCADGIAQSQDYKVVAKSFATWVSTKYPDGAVDVVAEGRSGLALRYALGMSGDPGWPALNVEDAVTLGSPHSELTDDRFDHPDGPEGTDWSAIGSDADEVTPAASAIDMPGADHRTTYKDGLNHQALLDDTSLDRTAHIVYSHGEGDEVTWNKAPHTAERVANELVYGVDSCGSDGAASGAGENSCSNQCKQVVAGWGLEFPCPNRGDLGAGVTGVTVTTPAGLKAEVPQVPGFNDPVSVSSARALALPIILPDLEVKAGGFGVTAYENTLGDDGLRVGVGSMALGRAGRATVYGLRIDPAARVSASSLEFSALGGLLVADGVHFVREQGLTADRATLGLPASLGGGEVSFRNIRVGADGSVSGSLDGAKVKLRDITIEISKGTLTDNGFSAGSASVQLPDYLGGTRLDAKNLKWDGSRLTLEEASGHVKFELSGGKLVAEADVNFSFDGRGGYAMSGSGHVSLPGKSGRPFFDASAELAIKSIDCDPAPGRCRNAVYLQHAAISITTDRPIPLGSTGLGIKGLNGSVHVDQKNPSRDAEGNVKGVTYTFGIGADVVTFPNDTVFDGHVEGSLSTNGNFGLSVDGKTLRFIDIHGGICVLFETTAGDTVCREHLKAENASKVSLPGAYVDVQAGAGVTYSGRLGTLNASLSAGAFGRFARSGGESYIDATLNGSFSASAHSWLFPDVVGQGRLEAQLGRFTKPGGGSVLGVKGKVDVTLQVSSLFGQDHTETQSRALFIDQDGHYTEENVDGYSLAQPTPGAPKLAGDEVRSAASGDYAFAVPRGQTETAVVLEAQEGSPELELETPGGRRVIAGESGSLRLVGPAPSGEERDQLAKIRAVRTGMPHTVIVYLPGAYPGRWTARVNGASPGRYRLDVTGNEALPRLAVSRPGPRRALTATAKRRVVAIGGTLSGADRGATVALYAAPGRCKGGARPGGAQPLASGVRVRGGSWHHRWDTKGLAPGRYSVVAELENGTGALVVACSKRAVVVKGRAHRRAQRKPRGRRARKVASATNSVFARPLVRAAAKPKDEKVKLCGNAKETRRSDDQPDERLAIPTFFVSTDATFDSQKPTPDIAFNDAAGISGKEWSGRGSPKTADAIYGKKGPFKHTIGDRPLHYGPLTPGKNNCADVSDANRKAACGTQPFRGTNPGPADGDPEKVSCDEFPFASTVEGGGRAIVRGVRDEENDRQGGLFGAFLRRHQNALRQNKGAFYVCVELVERNQRVGKCPK